jgi:hypothetical protein
VFLLKWLGGGDSGCEKLEKGSRVLVILEFTLMDVGLKRRGGERGGVERATSYSTFGRSQLTELAALSKAINEACTTSS